MTRLKIKQKGKLTCRMDLSKLARRPPGVSRGPGWPLVGEAGGVCTSTDRTPGEAPCRTSAKHNYFTSYHHTNIRIILAMTTVIHFC